ncbi:MAG: hypothetical protein AAGG08_13175 [Actinomycetota bacterium]
MEGSSPLLIGGGTAPPLAWSEFVIRSSPPGGTVDVFIRRHQLVGEWRLTEIWT